MAILQSKIIQILAVEFTNIFTYEMRRVRYANCFSFSLSSRIIINIKLDYALSVWKNQTLKLDGEYDEWYFLYPVRCTIDNSNEVLYVEIYTQLYNLHKC